MVYRDDELSLLRSELQSQKQRLDSFEALYREKGIKRRETLVGKVFKKFWRILATPFVFLGALLRVFQVELVVVLVIVAPLVALVCHGFHNYTVETHDLESRNRDAIRLEREQAAAATLALVAQCRTFCDTHGYHFYGERRDNACYCGTTASEEVAFIINVDTSENWTIVRNGE